MKRLRDVLQREQQEHIDQALEDFFSKPVIARTDLRQVANWVASDYLRRMGPEERARAGDWLKRNRPDVLDVIKKQYPHRVETGEVQTTTDLSNSFWK